MSCSSTFILNANMVLFDVSRNSRLVFRCIGVAVCAFASYLRTAIVCRLTFTASVFFSRPPNPISCVLVRYLKRSTFPRFC